MEDSLVLCSKYLASFWASISSDFEMCVFFLYVRQLGDGSDSVRGLFACCCLWAFFQRVLNRDLDFGYFLACQIPNGTHV